VSRPVPGSDWPVGARVAPQPAATPPGPNSWQPSNDMEQALAAATAAADRREYFQLLANADLYLPAFADADPAAPQRFVTMQLLGQEYLLVFTSPMALLGALGPLAQGYSVTNYQELRRKWPAPHWRLAVNPGTPIDCYVTVEAVAAAAVGDLVVPTADEIMAEAPPEALADSTPRTQLTEAAGRRDGMAFLAALLEIDVFVPVEHAVDAERVTQPDFPWRLVRRAVPDPRPGWPAQSTTIEVFLAEDLLDALCPPGTERVAVPFAGVVLGFPDPGYQLRVVAEGGGSVSLPGTYLSALVLWTPDEDEVDDLTD